MFSTSLFNLLTILISLFSIKDSLSYIVSFFNSPRRNLSNTSIASSLFFFITSLTFILWSSSIIRSLNPTLKPSSINQRQIKRCVLSKKFLQAVGP